MKGRPVELKIGYREDCVIGRMFELFIDENRETSITSKERFKKLIVSKLVRVIDIKFLINELKKSQKLTTTHRTSIVKGNICKYDLEFASRYDLI